MYPCPFCDQVFTSETERDRHIATEHPEMLIPTAGLMERLARMGMASNRVGTAAMAAAHLTKTYLSIRTQQGPPRILQLEEVLETFKWFYGSLFTSIGG